MPHDISVRPTPENPSGRERVRTLARAGVWALHRGDAGLAITHVPTGCRGPDHGCTTPKTYRARIVELGQDLPAWGEGLAFGQEAPWSQVKTVNDWWTARQTRST